MNDLLIAVILGIVEGLTEFVPISSTGHLIVADSALGFEGDRAATFQVVIQLGAILAVAVVGWGRLRALLTPSRRDGFAGPRGWGLLALTSLPALVLGVLLRVPIKDYLFTPTTVALGWGIGGVALLLVERYRRGETVRDLDDIGWRIALLIGFCQCLALWPGVSRAAATIGGAMLLGVGRRAAAEYSFFAAMPVLGAAAVFDLYASRNVLAASDAPMFLLGGATAFLAAWLAIRFFLRLLTVTTLRPFAWYRIVAALVLLVWTLR